MTEDKTITDNEVIARFMGAVLMHEGEWCQRHVFKEGVRTLAYFPEKLQYDTSWDWLMPVVEKIESLGYQVEICNQMCVIYNSMDVPIVIQGMPGMSKLQAAHKSVLEWIRWYNSTTQNKENSINQTVKK